MTSKPKSSKSNSPSGSKKSAGKSPGGTTSAGKVLPFTESESTSDDLAAITQSSLDVGTGRDQPKVGTRAEDPARQLAPANQLDSGALNKSATSPQISIDFEKLQSQLQRNKLTKKLHREFGTWPGAAAVWSISAQFDRTDFLDQIRNLKKWYRSQVDESGKQRDRTRAVELSFPPAEVVPDVIDDFYQPSHHDRERVAVDWLNQFWLSAQESDLSNAAVSRTLITAMLLPIWSARLDTTSFARLCQTLMQLIEGSTFDLTTEPDLYLAYRVELPAILNAYFWDCEIDLPLHSPANWDDCEHWYQSLTQLLDAEGWPAPQQISGLPRWLVANTRIAIWNRWRELEIPESVQSAWEWLLRNGMRLCWNRQGETLLGGDRLDLDGELLHAWRRLTTDDDEQKLIDQWLGEKTELKVVCPERSVLRDTACIAVFRGDWRHKSPKFALRYDQANCWLELSNRVKLMSGSCIPEFQLDGQVLQFQKPEFELNCWHTEDELDYLEIEMPLSHGFLWQRQIAFARYDRFIMIGDALLGDQSGKLSYRCRFPIAPGLEVRPETETRELYLYNEEPQALLLPISIGEWKQDHTANRFAAEENSIVFQQQQMGRAMMAAMVVDLDAKRSIRPRTWRSLTVGQSLQTAKPDQALAWRFQLDDQQYLMYRSLGNIANRTFLGVNVYSDFYLGRFDRDGEAESLISIE